MDLKFLHRALILAKKGEGFTSPNPCVGAVIVRDGKIIGEGWHKKAGSDHAEIVALKNIKNKVLLKGADLYVTLEPCCHFGKTPPCTSAIIESGIRKVFVGMLDPFDKVSGKGVFALKKAGIKVEILDKKDELARDIRNINQPFLKFIANGLPYLVMKAGISLDGKIATATNKSKWITNDKSREDARMERGLCDAVIIGANTVRVDNPELKMSGKYKSKKILKIVLDGALSLNLNYKIFKGKNVMIVCSAKADVSKINRFKKVGIEVQSFGRKKIDIKALLKFLVAKNVHSVFVEGGSETHGSFYDASLKNPD
ncbi:MAG: bifunctional diaminohydroxyphosphoribosylaminopyrimidine deaminase/5-amino-6-(5-phosphoribosylamino)uracil reductase RibD, partial [Candidatus Gracilibacteria bacterium]